MPALEMAQDNGKLLRWLKRDGDAVKKGEPLMEIETDKAAVEIEAPADGTLRNVTAREGDVIPVGKPIAQIFAASEKFVPGSSAPSLVTPQPAPLAPRTINASPVAQQIAHEHGIDLTQVKAKGARIEKADVMGFIALQQTSPSVPLLLGEGRETPPSILGKGAGGLGRVLASPKARRLANERGVDLGTLPGSGPDGAVLAADVGAALAVAQGATASIAPTEISTVWRIMAEHTTQSWVTVPHFFLLRDVNASRLVAWRDHLKHRGVSNITYTDLLVKLVAAALRAHPRVNAQWDNGAIKMISEINAGLAVAVEEGLVVPVIHRADEMKLAEIAARREDIVTRANASKLRPEDLRGGTITISNLGMYGVDAFNAIINAPQATILAVGRIAERVVPVNGAPGIQPMMTLSLSCDHRVVDGARGAQFLQTLAELIQEPLGLVE